MDFKKNYYAILGVPSTASRQEIKAAFKKLALLYHPDKNASPEAHERMLEVNEAYSILSDDIQKQVYDEYISYKPKEKQRYDYKEQMDVTTEEQPKGYWKEVKKQRKIKVFLNGTLVVKYWAEQISEEDILSRPEVDFRINPTEIHADFDEGRMFKPGSVPQEFRSSYATATPLSIPVRQPIRCNVRRETSLEHFMFDIKDLRVRDPRITNVTKYEKQSLGTVEADLYGYIEMMEDYYEQEYYEQWAGQTGNTEFKQEQHKEYQRAEYYHKDASTYWTDWYEIPKSSTGDAKFRQPISVQQEGFNFYSLLALLALLPLLFISAPFFATICLIALALYLIGLGLHILKQLLGGTLVVAAILLMLFMLVHGFNSFNEVRSPRVKRAGNFDTLSTTRREVTHQGDSMVSKDTLISHYIVWKDYSGTAYAAQFEILASDLENSRRQHAGLHGLSVRDISDVYKLFSSNDAAGLSKVYATFDSIRKVKSLSDTRFAEMVVSCIQSIPYYLILENDCNPQSYSGNSYVQQYLDNCNKDCCLGNIKYGLQSPLEFYGDLKGDCDTRSLLIYTLFSRFNYDVALLVSDYYKHAVIAVNLDNRSDGHSIMINGRNFLCWETTNKDFMPGQLPAECSNLNYWKVALLNNKVN